MGLDLEFDMKLSLANLCLIATRQLTGLVYV